MTEEWFVLDGEELERFERNMMQRSPRNLGRRNQRRYVRERIVLHLMRELFHSIQFHGVPWVNELIGAGVDDEMIAQEARRVAHRLKVSL